MKRFITIPFLLIAFSLFATPISEQKARNIASNFFTKGATRSSSVVLDMEWSGNSLNTPKPSEATTRTSATEEEVEGSLLYIFNRIDSKGFVVVAGDDKVQKPILAFSRNANFDINNMPDGAKAILQGWCEQVAATRADKFAHSVTRTENEDIGNVVVKHETAIWHQSAPFNNESPVYEGTETPCGCVALAAGIICRYHAYPEKGVGTTPKYTYTDDIGVRRTIPANTLGRTYDFNKILTQYDEGAYTEEEGAMVAALLYDLGTAFKMEFGQDGSLSSTEGAAKSLIEYFGYSKGAIYLKHFGRSEEEWSAMLRKNLCDYGPMQYGGSSDTGAHSFLLDGCTDKNYFSINFGWGGKSNGYYLMPEIKYYKNQAAVFYLMPDRDGSSTYRSNISLAAYEGSKATYKGLYTTADEFTVGSEFTVYIAIQNDGFASFNGEVCVAHCNKSGEIKDIRYTINRANNSLGIDKRYGYYPALTLEKPIEEGDRLLAFHRSSSSGEWMRAANNAEDAYDEILLCATPQDVARSLKLTYKKDKNTLTYNSIHAIQFRLINSKGETVMSTKTKSFDSYTIDLSGLEKGIYTLAFASGGEPYNLSFEL